MNWRVRERQWCKFMEQGRGVAASSPVRIAEWNGISTNEKGKECIGNFSCKAISLEAICRWYTRRVK